jgi:hypothetical protein
LPERVIPPGGRKGAARFWIRESARDRGIAAVPEFCREIVSSSSTTSFTRALESK